MCGLVHRSALLMQKTALASTSFILIYALFYLQHTGGRIAPPAFCLRLGPLKRPHADYTFLVYLLVLAMAIVIGYAFSAAPSCFERNAAACARQGKRAQCFSHCQSAGFVDSQSFVKTGRSSSRSGTRLEVGRSR